nr:hypothetical protein [Tanacetum cinerariifolium]
GASYPPKKLREDHETLSGTSVGDKSRSSLQRLLAGAMLNVEVGVTVVPTFPFLTASVSTTPEREDEGHTDSVAEPNLCTIGAPQRFVISLNSSHHSGPTIAEAEVDSLVRSSTPVMMTATTVTSMVDSALVAKEKTVKPSLFSADSSSADGAYPDTSVFRILLHVANGPRLDDGRVYHEMVAPSKFFAFVRGMEHDQLFIEFNVRVARHMSLSVEVRMQAEYNIKEMRGLKFVVEEKDELLKARDEEIENLKAQMLLKEAKATEPIRLRAEDSNFEIVEKSLRDEVSALKERIIILEKERNALDVKVTDLEASVVGKERDLTGLNAQLTFVHELELSSSGLQEKVTVYENCMEQFEKFQDDRMKTINDKFDKLYTDFMEMALHLEEKFYPHILTSIFDRRWLLTQGVDLAITKCLNLPEYLSALREAIGKSIEKGMQDGLSAGITHGNEGRVLTNVAAYNPSTEDASIEAILNVLRLEDPFADKLGLNDLRPYVDQLMVPIHHSPDKVVGTFGVVPAITDTTTDLSTTFASANTIDPIFVDDSEVVGTNDQAYADGIANPFPNVDDTELNIPQ